MRAFTSSDLGLIHHFDARNLDYLIEDRLDADVQRQARNAALLTQRVGSMELAAANDRPLGAAAREASEQLRSWKVHWRHEWIGDQGNTPRCTGFSGTKLWTAGPVTHPDRARGVNLDLLANDLYYDAQAVDRREGRIYSEGATMLALAKAMQARGWISAYYWGYSLAAFVEAVRRGPVLLGIDWLEGMDEPDPKHGVIRAIGGNRGGHAILADYADFANGMVGLDNTWGRGWGRGGKAYLPFEDLERLLAQQGEILVVDEVASARTVTPAEVGVA